jgi:NitT/TauT family transport system ATP-binding protein
MPSLKSRSLTKRFGDLEVLRDISVTINDGEFVALVGPSGCGKTTFLRIVSGLEAAEGGTISVDDTVVTGPGRDRGFVFQSDSLLPWRTVLDNTIVGLELAGRIGAADLERTRKLLSLVGLAGFESYFPRQLSGGMRQRASIARALVLEPEVLLLDEPFGALDAVTRRQMNVELQRIWSARQITTMLITHSVDEALFLADRVVVMSGRPGRILREVTVPFARPRDPAVMRSEEFHRLVDDLTGALDSNSSPPTGGEAR